MKRLILFLLVSAIAVSGYGQATYTPMVGAFQSKDTTGGKNVRFRSNVGVITPIVTLPLLKDSLANYAKIQDGVMESPTVTTNGDSLIIGNGVVRINSENVNFTGKTFADIPPSGANLSRIFVVYSDEDGLLDSISGVESNNPVPPTLPSNTQAVVTVSVSDAGLGVPNVDLSGYAKTDGSNINSDLFRLALNLNDFYVSKIISDTKNGNLAINGNLSATSSIRTTGYDNPGYSSGKGIEFRYDTANDRGSFLSYDRDNNLLKPMIFQASNYLFGDAIGTPGKLGINVNPPAYDLDVKGDVNIGSGSVYRINGIALSYENPLTFNAPLSRSTNTISIVDATGSVSGVVNTGAQTFGGAKTFNSTVRASNFGAGIAPNANHGFTGAASTSTTTPFLITPGVAYTGTQNGALHYVTADSTFRMMRFGSSDHVIFNNNNPAFKLSGLPRIVEANSSGSLSATKPIISILVTDSDIISAITGATYTSDRATITPASSKVMLTGQIYDDGTYTYIAIANNSVRRW